MTNYIILDITKRSTCKIEVISNEKNPETNIQVNNSLEQKNKQIVILPIQRQVNKGNQITTDIIKILFKKNNIFSKDVEQFYDTLQIKKLILEEWNIQEQNIDKILEADIEDTANHRLYLVYLSSYPNKYLSQSSINIGHKDYYWKLFVFPLKNNNEKINYLKFPIKYWVQYDNHKSLSINWILSI